CHHDPDRDREASAGQSASRHGGHSGSERVKRRLRAARSERTRGIAGAAPRRACHDEDLMRERTFDSDTDFDLALDDVLDRLSEFDDTTTGELELEERRALRRVAGLSTELVDVTEVEYRRLRLERVVLVGVWTEGTPADADNSLAELAALAETAGSVVLDGLIQRRNRPDPSTYIGRGK